MVVLVQLVTQQNQPRTTDHDQRFVGDSTQDVDRRKWPALSLCVLLGALWKKVG